MLRFSVSLTSSFTVPSYFPFLHLLSIVSPRMLWVASTCHHSLSLRVMGGQNYLGKCHKFAGDLGHTMYLHGSVVLIHKLGS